MTWCARCDVLTTGSAGDACPSCGEPILETTSGPRRSRPGTQLLELEAPPSIDVIEPPTAPSLPPAAPPRARFSAMSSRRSRALAALLVLAIAGGTYIGVANRTGKRPVPAGSTTPTAEHTPATGPLVPPLGSDVTGWIVFPAQRGFTVLELSTGRYKEIDLNTDVYMLATSPATRRIAFIDGFRVLNVTNQNGDFPMPIASEVDSFSWTQNGEAVVVARSQMDARGRSRTRIELISIEERTTLLLAETRLGVSSVMSRSGRHLVTVYEDSPSIYEAAPGSFRLIRRDALVLDLSPDGRYVLVSSPERSATVHMLDLATGKARRVGPKRFLGMAARFSRDGRRIALTGTPNVVVETGCEDPAGTCREYFVANDVILWTLDPKTLELRSIQAAGPDGMSSPVWGPAEWLLIQTGSRPIAIRLDDPSHATVRFDGDFPQDWLEPQYLS